MADDPKKPGEYQHRPYNHRLVDGDISDLQRDIAVIMEQTKDIPSIVKDIQEIKQCQREDRAEINGNKEDIQDLKKKSDNWNTLNTLGTLIAGGLAAIAAFWNGK